MSHFETTLLEWSLNGYKAMKSNGLALYPIIFQFDHVWNSKNRVHQFKISLGKVLRTAPSAQTVFLQKSKRIINFSAELLSFFVEKLRSREMNFWRSMEYWLRRKWESTIQVRMMGIKFFFNSKMFFCSQQLLFLRKCKMSSVKKIKNWIHGTVDKDYSIQFLILRLNVSLPNLKKIKKNALRRPKSIKMCVKFVKKVVFKKQTVNFGILQTRKLQLVFTIVFVF